MAQTHKDRFSEICRTLTWIFVVACLLLTIATIHFDRAARPMHQTRRGLRHDLTDRLELENKFLLVLGDLYVLAATNHPIRCLLEETGFKAQSAEAAR